MGLDDRPARFAGKKVEESAGRLTLTRSGQQYGILADWPVKALRNDPARTGMGAGQLSQRDEPEFGIPGFDELERLGNVGTGHQSGAQRSGQSQGVQRLDCGRTVWRRGRISDGEAFERAAAQRFFARHDAGFGTPQYESADRVGEAAFSYGEAVGNELLWPRLIGGEEEIKRRSLCDLGVELTGRTEAQHDRMAGLGCESIRNLPCGLRKVGGDGDAYFGGARRRCRRRAPGQSKGQREQPESQAHGVSALVAPPDRGAYESPPMNIPTLNSPSTQAGPRALVDRFGRRITYLRVSVTDRCDFRCTYCMAEHMTFLPKSEVLSIEELEAVSKAFIDRGVSKIRLTGGEPLVRRDIMVLIERLGHAVASGALNELTLTTNGSQLRDHARRLAGNGVRRINVSLDTLDAAKFAAVTRRGRLEQVLDGIDAAQEAGLAVKINMVALKGVNDAEIPSMLEWAHGRGMDLTLIETMPMGGVDIERADQYLPLSAVREMLEARYTLAADDYRSGGPARYFRVVETGGRLGLITPLTHNFCESCNRVRLTCTGELYLCLGQNDRLNLRDVLRAGGPDALDAALDHAMAMKPKGHDFVIDRSDRAPAVERFMSTTGG